MTVRDDFYASDCAVGHTDSTASTASSDHVSAMTNLRLLMAGLRANAISSRSEADDERA